MRSTKMLLMFMLGIATIAVLSPRIATADDATGTIATFTGPVEIPGRVLPAGTYVFRLVDPYMDNNVVEIWNKGQNRLYATLITLPEYRNEPSPKTEFQLEERGQGSPMAIKSWFNEGDSTGHEFMYPRRSSATE